MTPRNRGFTLIELVIAMVVIGILVAVAFPSYQAHLIKGYRAAAQSYLMDVAQKQQQYLLDNRAYAGTEAALNATQPAEVSKYYTVAIAADPGPPPTFTITATPKAGTMQASEVTLSIDQAGQKLPSDKW